MKVLVVLCAVVAGCLAQYGYEPSLGYGYSALSPLTGYSSAVAPFSYAYSAPIYSAAPYSAALPLLVKKQYHSQNELGVAQYGHDEPGQSHHAVQDAYGNKMGSFSYVDHHGGVHQTHYVADAGGYRVQSNDLPIGPAAPAAVLHRKKRQAWNGPAANIQVTPSGHLAQTPEVAAATAAHQAEVARASRQQSQQPQQSWNQAPAQSWNQPQAQSWNQQPAPVNDYSSSWAQPQTQTSLASLSRAAAVPTPQWNLPQARVSNTWAQQQPQAAAPQWTQAQAVQAPSWNQQQSVIPQVQRDGTLADTPEVAQAKAAHFQEFNRAAEAARSAGPGTGPAQFPGQEDDGSYKPEPQQDWNAQSAPTASWNTQSAAQAPSWNQGAESRAWQQPQATQSWNQPQAQSWQQPQAAAQSWQQPQATAYSAQPATQSWQQPAAQSWQQPAAQSWNQQPAQSWNQPRAASWESSPASWNQPAASGVPQDTPEVAAAKLEHQRALAAAQG